MNGRTLIVLAAGSIEDPAKMARICNVDIPPTPPADLFALIVDGLNSLNRELPPLPFFVHPASPRNPQR